MQIVLCHESQRMMDSRRRVCWQDGRRRIGHAPKRRGVTLLELMFVVGISAMMAALIMGTFIAAPRVLLGVSRELRTREQGARALRTIETALRGSNFNTHTGTVEIQVFSAYNDTTSALAPGVIGTYISIINPNFSASDLPESPSGHFGFYYYAPPDSAEGGIYFNPDADHAPNPALNPRLIRSGRIVGFEVRQENLGNAVWIHIVGDTRANLASPASESKRIHLVASVRPRIG